VKSGAQMSDTVERLVKNHPAPVTEPAGTV